MASGFTLFTLGHGTASAEDFAGLVRALDLAAVVDVRSFPGSRRHPQFARTALEDWLPELSGAAYRWQPALGGFRKPDPDSLNVALRHPAFRGYADYMASAAFAEALDALVREAARVQTAVMCSESLWWRCHRRLIADAAVLQHGATVAHLGHDGHIQSHVFTEGVRLLADGKLRYDALPLLAPTE
jgi:uncharacterized protein (DUF488 family)